MHYEVQTTGTIRVLLESWGPNPKFWETTRTIRVHYSNENYLTLQSKCCGSSFFGIYCK
ncbi:hypothetical protein Hanom_Chr17g01541551 [Helianthus anomalus]